MTLEELKEKHSELYQAAFDSGAKSVDLGVSEENGRKAERERVTAILAIDGDAVAMRQAITEGLSVESTYKLLFEAEVKRKTEALAQMQASAPQSLGQQTPQEPEPEITGDVAQLVSDKALAMSLKDGIDIHAATKMVLASDKKLASAYRATFQA